MKKYIFIFLLAIVSLISCTDCENRNKYHWVKYKNGEVKYYYEVYATQGAYISIQESPCVGRYSVSLSEVESFTYYR